MPRTFKEKMMPQMMNKWLVLERGKSVTYVYATHHLYYTNKTLWSDSEYIPYTGTGEAKDIFVGYYIEQERGKPFTYESMKAFYDPFKGDEQDKNIMRLPLSTLIECYKLNDAMLRQKLDRYLAKKLLHGRN